MGCMRREGTRIHVNGINGGRKGTGGSREEKIGEGCKEEKEKREEEKKNCT